MLQAGLGVQPERGAPRCSPRATAGQHRPAGAEPGNHERAQEAAVEESHSASCKSTENSPAADAPPLKKPSVKERNRARAEGGARGSREVVAGEDSETDSRVRRKEQL